MRVGQSLQEMLDVHGLGDSDPRVRISQALREAQLPDDAAFQSRYPHQLSGGQQQRVAIALALICRPRVVVMDEPTTGLDVMTQARLLEVVRRTVRESNIALVYVSHDLGVVRNLVDEVIVMYAGRIVETGPVDDIFASPRHPYTRRLLEAVPRILPTAFQPRGIQGTAVEPWNRPAGCPFAPRCDYREEACEDAMPMPEAPAPERVVRCINWRALPERTAGLEPFRERHPSQTSEARATAILEVRELQAGYGRRSSFGTDKQGPLAVGGVSFTVEEGSCTAVVGESGSGKTTTLRCVVGLHEPFAGSIAFRGAPLAGRARARDGSVRRKIQLVPQNPDSSLNPRRTVEEIVGRPLRQFFGVKGRPQRVRVVELLEQVRLRATMASRYPRDLSGGERQRVAVARALAAEPDLLLCDEIVAALDVAVQAGILDLLEDLRTQLGTTIVFVSHDLAVVRSISADIVVMQEGEVRELGPTEEIFRSPTDAYTRALLDAVPDLRPSDYPGLNVVP
jgi:peptide/nickel transport system ATP-binding protein